MATTVSSELLSRGDVTTFPVYKLAAPSDAMLTLAQMRRVVNDVVLPVIFSLGIIGNVLNAVLLTRRRETGSSSFRKNASGAGTSRRQRSDDTAGRPSTFERSATVGLVALTASDLAFCLVGFVRVLFVQQSVPVRTVSADWRRWSLIGVYYAAYRGALLNLFLFTSTWMIALVSIERYLAVCHPFRAAALIKVRRTAAAHVIVVVVSVLVNVPLFLRNTVLTVCSPTSVLALSPPLMSALTTVAVVPEAGVNSSYIASLVDDDVDDVTDYKSTVGGNCSESGLFHHVASSALSKNQPAIIYTHRVVWFAFGTFIPLLLIAYCNARLVVEVYSIRKHSEAAASGSTAKLVTANGRSRPTGKPPMSRGSSTVSSATIGGGSRGVDGERSVALRLTMTLIAIVVCFVVLVCPSMLVQFVWFTIDGSSNANGGAGRAPPATHRVSFQTALLITDLMQAVKFSSNFLLYCVVSRSFRRTFGNLMRIQRCRQRCRRDGLTMTKASVDLPERINLTPLQRYQQQQHDLERPKNDAACDGCSPK